MAREYKVKVSKSDKRPIQLTKAQIKKLCEEHMIRGCALTAIAFAEELLLTDDQVLACVNRFNNYDLADADHLVSLNRMIKLFCSDRELEEFMFR